MRAAAGADGEEDRMSVDDDEFEAYLESLAGKKKKKKGKADDADDDEEFDFLADLEGEQGKPPKKPKQKRGEEADDDWDSDGSNVDEDGYVGLCKGSKITILTLNLGLSPAMTTTWAAARMRNLVAAMMDRYHWRVTAIATTSSKTNPIPK